MNGGNFGGWVGGGWVGASPGTQTSGYAFGYGQGADRANFGGGGGGWYGGYGSYNLGGAGGSSYLSGISGGTPNAQYIARTGWTKVGANALGAAGKKGTDCPIEIQQMNGYGYSGGIGAARFRVVELD